MVRTDWLSMIAALGWGARPNPSRTRSRKAAELKCKRVIGHIRELEDEPELPPGNYADRHELAEAKERALARLAGR